jgi:hypothetical protein
LGMEAYLGSILILGSAPMFPKMAPFEKKKNHCDHTPSLINKSMNMCTPSLLLFINMIVYCDLY